MNQKNKRKSKAFRTEKDSMGEVQIPKDRLWGAVSQRSLENFKIGQSLMPLELIYALALIKESCAVVFLQFQRLKSTQEIVTNLHVSNNSTPGAQRPHSDDFRLINVCHRQIRKHGAREC